MAQTTKGTHLWFQKADGTLVRVQCAKSISGLDSTRDQIDTTCMDSVEGERSYESGLATHGTATLSIDLDPGKTGHKELKELHLSGTKVDWAIGQGDGTDAPTSVQGVLTITVTNGGSGYTSAPTVGFTGGGGSGATATATVSNGQVVSITVTAKGSAYTSAPTVTFTGGSGTGAAATAATGYYISTPTTRTFKYFNGYVASFGEDFQTGAVITANVGIQLSSFCRTQWKT